MRTDRKAFLVTSCAAVATAALGAPACVAAAGESIRIGTLPCLTGANAALGQQEHEGILLAVGEINARSGKVYGDRPFEIVEEDATNDNQSAVSSLNKLLGENVVAVICPALSNQVQAMAPVMKTRGIPWLTGGTAVTNTQLGVAGLFRLRASDASVAAAMAKFGVDTLKRRKIAILHPSSVLGGGGPQPAIATAKLGAAGIVANVGYAKANDITAELNAIKNAGADVLLLFASAPDVPVILRQIHDLPLNIPVVGSPAVGSRGAIEASGQYAEGVYAATDVILVPASSGEASARFATSFARKYGHAADAGSAWPYDAVYMLAEVFKKQQSTDPQKTVGSLKAVKNRQGVLGTYNCDAEGNMMHDVSIGRVQGGTLRLVAKVSD